MTANGWIQIGLFCLAIIVCVKPLGLYMARLFEGERTFLSPVLGPSSAASTGCAASSRTRSSTGPPTPSPCWPSASPALSRSI